MLEGVVDEDEEGVVVLEELVELVDEDVDGVVVLEELVTMKELLCLKNLLN